MNRELIEWLKHNDKGWVFLSDEEQDCMRQINDQCGLDNLHFSGAWESHGKPWPLLGEGADEIFRIKPDYKPESEDIEIEVVLNNCGMCVLKDRVPGCEFKMLWWVESNKDFVCFHDPFGKETTNAGDVPGWMRILAAQDGNVKIHARFLKEVEL